MKLRQQPLAIRVAVTVVIAALGVVLGYVLALGFLLVVVAVFGHIDDSHPVRQLVILGAAYAITAATTLGVAVLAWRRVFR